MNRSYQHNTLAKHRSLAELRLKTAIHEAGHAAAIYLGNKQKCLPPVFFQITVAGLPSKRSRVFSNCSAKLEGGRLIHTLSSSVEEAVRNFSAAQKRAYLSAFDADIINLLVGPLAEANYLALMADDMFSPCHLSLAALPRYGGAADLKAINDYLDCFSGEPLSRQNKINALFAEAFGFINDRGNWRAIIALAQAILANKNQTLGYQDIVAVLEGRRPSPGVAIGDSKTPSNRRARATAACNRDVTVSA